MRIVKQADARKNEILDAAEQLFNQKGFDGTSTNDILHAVGIARGTLYYHFKSKEDIMDSLIERYSEHIISQVRQIAADTSIAFNERIVRVILSINSKVDSKELMEHIHKPQNALMHQKIQRLIITRLTPILADIIREGINSGAYDTPFPYEVMEMILVYASAIFDDELVELTREEFAGRIQAFIYNTERLLGVEHGSLLCIMKVFENGKDAQNE